MRQLNLLQSIFISPRHGKVSEKEAHKILDDDILVQEPDRPIMHPPQDPPTLYFFRNLIPSRFENQNVPSKKLGSTVYFTDQHFTDQGFLSAIRTWYLPSFQLKLASKLIETFQKCSRYLEF